MNIGNLLLIVSIFAMQLGCTGLEYRSRYPVVPKVTDRDPDLSCELLDDEILRANALRDAIYEEHNDVLDEAEIEAWDIISATRREPEDIFVDMLLDELAEEDRSGEYMEAAGAAGQRLEQLLIYKEDRSCSGPTSDLESSILTALSASRDQVRTGELNTVQYASRRRELLDALR